MAMPPSATFHYIAEVPKGVAQASPWQMKSAESFQPRGDSLLDCRLVGWNPLLHISDAGMTPNPSASRPAVLRSELKLVATDKKYAAQPTDSYFLDRVLVRALREGDVFHMARTACGGFAASAIRQGKLIFAIGQISAVPLGSGIEVKTPYDLVAKAQKLFRERDREFEFPELPIEVRWGNVSEILYSGVVQLGGYHVRVEHGFRPCIPGIPENVSVSLDEACDWIAASASAQLLNEQSTAY